MKKEIKKFYEEHKKELKTAGVVTGAVVLSKVSYDLGYYVSGRQLLNGIRVDVPEAAKLIRDYLVEHGIEETNQVVRWLE